MLRKLILLVLLLGLLFKPGVRAEYVLTGNCKLAYEQLMDLKIVSARETLRKEMTENPDNYYAYYLAHYVDAFDLMINTTEDRYLRFIENYEKRRGIMDEKDMDSPYYLAFEGEMQLYTGIFNIIMGDRFTGVRRAYGGYKKVYKNLDAFPGFQPSLKISGLFNIALSNLPPFIRWAVGAFGISGDAEKGMQILKDYFTYTKDIKGLNADAALFTILAYKLDKDPLKGFEAYAEIEPAVLNYTLLDYLYANVAYRSGHNEQALALMQKIQPDSLEIPFYPYYYMTGKILLRKLDPDAGYYLKEYLDKYKANDYRKEINYKLALYYLINGNKIKFDQYRVLACDEGDEVTERNREAMYDCQLDYIPKPELVKAKLLLDGNYLERFQETIEKYPVDENTFLPYQLEYKLLLARFKLRTGGVASAEVLFKDVIETGGDEHYYFATEAAMHLGLYFENKNRTLAIKYLKLAIDLYDSDYYEYIDDKSRKALNRLEE
ncbi:MAG: hypothetical protein L3J31_08145 [Bacteroidales bacterium]|nr:hypothetical protein [Bacteroidales bacterium]MCF6342758.1 hypothetical protein [Bacteroidales bacterium]